MPAIAKYATVSAPVEKVYEYWRNFTNFPEFIPNVREVTPIGGDDTRTHWKVDGPLGQSAEWDAHIVEDVPNEKIAWAAVGGSNTVATSGAVRFDDHGGTTGVEVSLQYDPPAGVVGEAVAKLFADPQDKVEKALAAFKSRIESGTSSQTPA